MGGGAFYTDCLPMSKNGGGNASLAPPPPPVPPPLTESQMIRCYSDWSIILTLSMITNNSVNV